MRSRAAAWLLGGSATVPLSRQSAERPQVGVYRYAKGPLAHFGRFSGGTSALPALVVDAEGLTVQGIRIPWNLVTSIGVRRWYRDYWFLAPLVWLKVGVCDIDLLADQAKGRVQRVGLALERLHPSPSVLVSLSDLDAQIDDVLEVVAAHFSSYAEAHLTEAEAARIMGEDESEPRDPRTAMFVGSALLAAGLGLLWLTEIDEEKGVVSKLPSALSLVVVLAALRIAVPAALAWWRGDDLAHRTAPDDR